MQQLGSIVPLLLILAVGLLPPKVFADAGEASKLGSSPKSGVDPSLDPYSMTREQLSKIGRARLYQEIDRLQQKLKHGEQLIKKVQAFNQRMCAKLEMLERTCVAQSYLIPPVGMSDLSCSPSEDSQPAPIYAEISGPKGMYFRLMANRSYVSSVFSTDMSRSKISFSRADNKIRKAPRFRELTSLELIQVESTDSGIAPGGIITHRVNYAPDDKEKLKLRVFVGSKNLIASGAFLALSLPSSGDLGSSLKISPEEVLTMGRTPKCIVTLKDINKMRDQAYQSAEGGE